MLGVELGLEEGRAHHGGEQLYYPQEPIFFLKPDIFLNILNSIPNYSDTLGKVLLYLYFF